MRGGSSGSCHVIVSRVTSGFIPNYQDQILSLAFAPSRRAIRFA
jgi:hypothetical protein